MMAGRMRALTASPRPPAGWVAGSVAGSAVGSTASAPTAADLTVLLPSREPGGHEQALVGWLSDAALLHGLRPDVRAVDPALQQALEEAGLPPPAPPAAPTPRPLHWQPPSPPHSPPHSQLQARLALLAALREPPRDRPVLLAPGVLHAAAWLLAAAVACGRPVWVYVPMAFSGRRMGHRYAVVRDAALAPWVRRVSGWITLDERQAGWLRDHWGVRAPILTLPNQVRTVSRPLPAAPSPVGDERLRVAFVGRFDPAQKGLDWLIAALLARPELRQRCHWIFQGRGQAEAALLQLACSLGPQHVQVRAPAPIDGVLAEADLLLLASRFEGVPLVALEATVLGVPVVATQGSGLGRLLPPSSLYRFGHVEGLSRALGSLACPDKRRAAVMHARLRLALEHDPERYAAALRRVVLAIRAGPGAPAPC